MPLLADPLTAAPSHGWLVEMLLREQQELPAVERFSQWHEAAPQHAQHYRELIPLTLPDPGEQYAFEVDLDACSGCKACVTACHSLNGLEDEETWRSVGLLQGKIGGQHALRYVTTACHHCVEPACLQGCPTKAYEKDSVTGIVRHLDDQCFGCQYCVLMCPYEVPKYSAAKGIVRKCDMCRQRLAADEAPACVQACPSQAIKIRVVNVAQVIARTEANDFLPSAPDARLTRPTTRFLGAAALSLDPQAGDHAVHAPAHAHWPLVFMLVLTQMSLGIVALGHLLTFWLGVLPVESARAIVNASAALIGASGASLALLHLGRPQIAYRAWLGWRTSWLSREVLAFGVYVPLLLLTAVVGLSTWSQSRATLLPMLEIACVLAGVVAVYCSAMIYIATRRAWWNARRTLTSFGLTAFLLGNSVCMALAALYVAPGESLLRLLPLLVPAMVIVGWRLAGDGKFLRGSLEGLDPAIRDTGELLSNRPLRYVLGYQRLLAFAAAFGCPLLVLFLLTAPLAPDALRIAVAAVCFAGVACLVTAELIGRYLFFAACVPPRMPGGLP